MKIGDRVYVHGYVDEIRKDTVIIRNEGGYFGTVKSEIVEAQKAEDIVSVIRCKDCNHRDWDVVDIPYGLTKRKEWCSIRFNADGENIEVSPNDFCSKAERKVSSNFE